MFVEFTLRLLGLNVWILVLFPIVDPWFEQRMNSFSRERERERERESIYNIFEVSFFITKKVKIKRIHSENLFQFPIEFKRQKIGNSKGSIYLTKTKILQYWKFSEYFFFASKSYPAINTSDCTIFEGNKSIPSAAYRRATYLINR